MDFRRLSEQKSIVPDEDAALDSSNCQEKTNLKNVLPQVVASTVSALYRVMAGIFFGYLALAMSHPKSNDDVLVVLFQLIFGMSSVPVGGVVCAFLIDRIGRLNTIKLAVLPAIVGSIIVSVSEDFSIRIMPIVLTGISLVCGCFPAIVYTTEIAHPDLRGCLLSIGPFLTSLGLVVTILAQGAITLKVAIIIVALCSIGASISVHFLPESPIWLICKGKNQARKSLEWLDKYQPPPTSTMTFAQLHYNRLVQEHEKLPPSKGCCQEIRKPGFYKPLLILLGLLFLQQLSGMCTLLVFLLENSVQKLTSGILDPNFAVISFGLQAAATLANLLLFRLFRRRTLFVCGSAAMTMCFVIFAIVNLVEEGRVTYWTSAVAFILCIGVWMTTVLPVPATMMAELFPDRIRGVAYCVVHSLSYVTGLCGAGIMYFLVDRVFPGKIVWLFVFALPVFLATLAYAYVFLPETHKVELSEVQKCFQRNGAYIMWVRARRRESRVQREEVPMDEA